MDPSEPFFSARYASPPPPMPAARRPHLQFPPPPPYPPPGGGDVAVPPPQPPPNLRYFDDVVQPTLYEDEAGNIVILEDFGMNNLAMCLDDEQFFSERRFSPYKFPPNDEQFSCKTSHKVLFNEQTKLNSPKPIPPQHFLNNSLDFRREPPPPSPADAAAFGASAAARRNASPFGNAKKPNDIGRSRLPTAAMAAGKPAHFNARRADEFEPDAYSYAYYEPGPCGGGGGGLLEGPSDRRNSRESRHTYTTRHGIEENIYEEISEVAALASKLHDAAVMRQSQIHESNGLRQTQLHEANGLRQSQLHEANGLRQSQHQDVNGTRIPQLHEGAAAKLRDGNVSHQRPGSPMDLSQLHEADGVTVGRLDGSPTKLQEGGAMKQSQLSLNQSVYEAEIGLVELRHRRVLGELNLTVEAMLMPSCRDPRPSSAAPSAARQPDLLEDLLNVGPTDELLSPPPEDAAAADAVYQSFKRPALPTQQGQGGKGAAVPGSPGLGRYQRLHRSQEIKQSFWTKKGWRCLPKIGVVKDEPRVGVRAWEEPAAPRRADALQRGLSSEESWYSGSDRDVSSGDESERGSVHSSKSNGQLKSTLTKALHLCDKLRTSQRVEPTAAVATPPAAAAAAGSEGRLARWFSIRRGAAHQYDVDATERSTGVGNMPLLSEAEEDGTLSTALSQCTFQRRQVPPTLPPPPAEMTPAQLKRRHIVAAIVHSENSYVATLQRLVNDYKKPLEEANPPILSSSKISTLFHRLPEILQCHTLFRIALAESIRNWDKEERLGDVFVASFSKAVVLDVYSGFINNFSAAMDLAKMEAKRKSALADFLKVKQISAHDRLSFFGLMVKPVQRFPQFILFLQDLLKHTPHGHRDRMSLQLALTQLESLAELLNERKREAEQFQAFRETLRHLSGKFTARPLSDANRCLIREDDVTQLEFNQNGLITKSKRRRLLLLNDLVVCVSVAPRQSEDFGSAERLSLKWTVPVMDVEVVDTSGSPTLSRLLAAGLSRNGSLKSDRANANASADNLCLEMSQLMHDFEVVSRIQELAATLNDSYQGLTADSTRGILSSIQSSIQRKDEQMAWVDSCCLQIVVRGTKSKDDLRYTFQTDNPNAKKEWSTELRLARLALDVANSPAWEIPEQERRPSAKMPLFVRSMAVHSAEETTEVKCGCFHLAPAQPSRGSRKRHHPTGYLWLATAPCSDPSAAPAAAPADAGTRVSVLAQGAQGALRELAAFDVAAAVTAVEHVRGQLGAVDTVWIGTATGRLFVHDASDPERHEALSSTETAAAVTSIRQHGDAVFVALADGSLLRYAADQAGWRITDAQLLELGTEPVAALLTINAALYAACGKTVWVLDGGGGGVGGLTSADSAKSFTIQHEHGGAVGLMAHSGVGLWISLAASSTICLYHTETFKHLQDINIASNVLRVATNPDCDDCTVTVTALLACKGLLWVGTNVGVGLTIPLPRLEGVPIISGRVNISYHAHFGPITFLLALQPRGWYAKPAATAAAAAAREKREEVDPATAGKPRQLTGSPVVLRRRSKTREEERRASKTLPRGLGAGLLSTSTLSSQGSAECDVYGLYGELMYVRDYEEDDAVDPDYESLRRSDPDLAAIPNKVSTLDRRLKMKVGRPRSLDLSNWSVDSRTSSVCTSSSEEPSSRLVSRNNSSASTLPADQADVAAVDAKKEGKGKAKAGPAADGGRRTVITLMGGRGYVNWRQSCCGGGKPNERDAHIAVWEMKL